MQEIKVSNSSELKDKVRKLILNNKELKICQWYNRSQTIEFTEKGGQKVIKEACSGVKLGENFNPTIDIYFENNNCKLISDPLAGIRDELESEFQDYSNPLMPNSNYQPPQEPQKPVPPQDRQEPSSPTSYQPKPKDKNSSQNNHDNEDIINLINKYFQENQASSIELSKDKKCLIINKENGWIQCTPISGSQLQKIKNHLEKNNKNSISKQELTSPIKSEQTNINPSASRYLNWILGILLIIVSGLAIWLLRKNRKKS